MRSILPILKQQRDALRSRLSGVDGTLDLLRDLGANTKEYEAQSRTLHTRLHAIEQDIHILERGYAAQENRRG